MAPAPTATIDVPTLDVVELFGGTSAPGVQVAASVVGAIAGLTLLAFVIGALGGLRPSRWRTLATFAAVSAALSASELALLIADGAALDDRRIVTVATRLVVLLAGAAMIAIRSQGNTATTVAGTTQPAEPPALAGEGRDPLDLILLALAALTVPLAAPDAGGGEGLGLALARWTVVAVVMAAGLRLLDRRAEVVGGAIVGTVLVAGAVVGIVGAPDRVPARQEVRVLVDDTVIDLTVVPARAGTNELHLYAWDREGNPRALDRSEVRVIAAPGADADASFEVAHELFVVSPNHHLSYAMELPGSRRGWELELRVDTSDGDQLTATTELEAS